MSSTTNTTTGNQTNETSCPERFKKRRVFVYNDYKPNKTDRELLELAYSLCDDLNKKQKITDPNQKYQVTHFYSFCFTPEPNGRPQRKVIFAFNKEIFVLTAKAQFIDSNISYAETKKEVTTTWNNQAYTKINVKFDQSKFNLDTTQDSQLFGSQLMQLLLSTCFIGATLSDKTIIASSPDHANTLQEIFSTLLLFNIPSQDPDPHTFSTSLLAAVTVTDCKFYTSKHEAESALKAHSKDELNEFSALLLLKVTMQKQNEDSSNEKSKDGFSRFRGKEDLLKDRLSATLSNVVSEENQ